MLSMKRIKDLKGKRVIIRIDANVPIEKGKVVDNERIIAHKETLVYLIKHKAKIIIIAHVGRPGGKVVKKYAIDPVIREIERVLRKKVQKIETKNWKWSKKREEEVIAQTHALKPGQIAMCDNVRFAKEEKKNGGTLAKTMASLGDLFVFDGFAVAHRPAASVIGISKYLPSYTGFLMQKEIKGLEKVVKKPSHPLVIALGGVKMKTKVEVIKNFIKDAESILIGGGLANTYFGAKGYGIGNSRIDKEMEQEIMKYGKKNNVFMPIDVIVGDKNGKAYSIVDIKKKPHLICNKQQAIFDIGPKTLMAYIKHIEKAKTVIWNGAMGYFEQSPYHIGTMAIAESIARASKKRAYTIIGGGETLQAATIANIKKDINLVSTGGGAMISFLSGSVLPAIDALQKKK
jgi:3-phosphoglycerate kinase